MLVDYRQLITMLAEAHIRVVMAYPVNGWRRARAGREIPLRRVRRMEPRVMEVLSLVICL